MDYTTVLKLPQFFRNLHRVSEIMGVLIRHGFGDMVDRINTSYGKPLKIVLPSLKRQDGGRQVLDVATRLRLVFEDLGPTFIKVGQFIATRQDVFPSNIINEFKKLQDQVEPFSSELAIATLEDEFKVSLSSLFSSFSEKPLAAGSIAQVHQATLPDGTDVVVKIRRPNIERTINTDMDIIRGLVSLLEDAYPELSSFNLPLFIEECHRTLLMECDFRKEAQNMILFATQHKNKMNLVVPHVYPALCGKSIVTQEFIKGRKASELKTDVLPNNGLELVNTLAKVLLDSIFVHRFFHADPHPGNIIITKDEKLALIDYGEMGRIDKQRVGMLLKLLIATLAKDPERLLQILKENKMTPAVFDEATVRVQITVILDAYLDQSLGQLDLASLLSEIFEVVRRYGIKPPADILMIAKSLTLLESVAAALAPGFNPASFIKPYLTKHYISFFADPKSRSKKLFYALESYKHFISEFPSDMRLILANLASGEMTIQASIKDLKKIKEHQNQMLNRFLLTLIGIFLIILGVNYLPHNDETQRIMCYIVILIGILSLVKVWLAIRKNDGL